MAIMGIVRLAPGRVGYYDEITRIHLTISSPERPITEGMNTTNLKRAVRSRVLNLVSGSLDPETKTPVTPNEVQVPPEVLKSQGEEVHIEEIPQEVTEDGKQEIEEDIEEPEIVKEPKVEHSGNDDAETNAAADEHNDQAEEEVSDGKLDDVNDAEPIEEKAASAKKGKGKTKK
jgi:hypothetical protein